MKKTVERERERAPFIFLTLLASCLLLLAACPNGSNGDNLTPVPESATLTGYSDIKAKTEESIAIQTPKPSNKDISFIYSISPDLPTGLVLDENTGELSGTPTTKQTSATYTITATAQSPHTGSINATIDIWIYDENDLTQIPAETTLTGYSNITQTAGQEITKQNPILSGISPAENITFTYSISPLLPGGLMIDEDTGELSGTPTTKQTSATYTITATAQFPHTGSIDATIDIWIYDENDLTQIPAETALTGYSNITQTAGQEIAKQNPALSGISPTENITFTYSISPLLPEGLMIDEDTGELSGTPTTKQTSATYTITATAQFPHTGSIDATIDIWIYDENDLTQIPAETALTGYSNITQTAGQEIAKQNPALSGISPTENITFTYSISPLLPGGLMIDEDTGELSGTPTTPQASTEYTITATAQFPHTGSIDATIDIWIYDENDLTQIPAETALTGYSNITQTAGQEITKQNPILSGISPAENITFTYSISPLLPGGLMIDEDTGELSGTPTTIQASQEYTITAAAQPPYTGTVEAKISITIIGPLPASVTFSGYSSIVATTGETIEEQNPVLSNLPTEITFTYSVIPNLPNGLVLNTETGTLSGTPTTQQDSNQYTITAAPESPYTGTRETTIDITVHEAISAAVALTGYSNINIEKDTPITSQNPNPSNLPTGGITFTYSISPDLPTGLVLDKNTGGLSGIPTTPQASTEYTITAAAQPLYTGTVEAKISITITGPLPASVTFSGYSSIVATTGETIEEQNPVLSNLPTEITFTYSVSPNLPDGLVLNTETGTLSGTPTTQQTSNQYTITAAPESPYTDTRETTIDITVHEAIPAAVALTGYSNINIEKDTPITSQNPSPSNLPTGGITFTYSISPDLPTGLVLDKNTGGLSGIPTTPQASTEYTITAAAQPPYTGTLEAKISIMVPGGPLPAEVALTGYSEIRILKETALDDQNPAPSNLPEGGINFTYSINPPVPDGLIFDSGTGVLSGIPTTPQEPVDYTITATALEPYSGTLEAVIPIMIYKVQAANRANLLVLIDAELADPNGNLNFIDTSLVTNMLELFSGKTTFNEDISHWDVSSVTNMFAMFMDATAFNQDLSNWDVSSVTDMYSMFRNVATFNQDLSNWNVSSVTRLQSMFQGATAFNSDISSWIVTDVEVFVAMFYGATAFNQDLSNWDVSSATNMRGMFDSATAFNQDLESWNVADSVDTIDMFKNSGMASLPSWY